MKEFYIVVENKEQTDLIRNTLEDFGYKKYTFFCVGFPRLLLAHKYDGRYVTSGADIDCELKVEEISMGEFKEMFMNKQTYTEDYFKSYKHVIGCDFEAVYGKKGIHIINVFINGNGNRPVFFDNTMCGYSLEFIKFYIDDETLGTYEEYMNANYQEYKHWWEIK